MSYKVVTTLKKGGLLMIIFIGLLSCENDLEDIAIDLVENQYFSVGKDNIEIISYNINIEKSRTDNNYLNPIYLLGVNKNAEFGHMKSTFIPQVLMSSVGGDFGDNAIIDLVVLDIPYYATKDGNQDAVDPETGVTINDSDGNAIQTPNYKLDSVYGNIEETFNISVNELGTFLNVLDPNDPTKKNTYYSDKDYVLKDELFSDDFILNRNDTVLYVERRFLDDDPATVDDIDTIKAANASPSMKFYLDKEFFKTRFVEHSNPSDFDSNDNFTRYFRGLYIDANGDDGALINLAGSNAKMTIYYTNDITGSDDVVERTKQTMHFNFGGVRTGKYERDYSGFPIENYLTNKDTINGENKLFVQGAGGSEVVIDLFTEESLELLREKKWLINEANITLYLDGDQDEVPNTLFLYNYDYNSALKDYMIDGPDIYGGKLEYDSDDKPVSYKFRITRFISNLLDLNDPKKLTKLVLKNYSTTDIPTVPLLDTIVKEYNWIPKGVVLKGNLANDVDKRIKLEIYYSEAKE